MNILMLLAAALLPAIFLWIYIWKKDSQPEPSKWLAKASLLGMGIFIPLIFIEPIIQLCLFGYEEPTTLFGTTIKAFIVAALPEEAFKLLALWLILRKNPYFDEHFDGIVYAVFVGLGFAAIENLFYIVNNEGSWFSVAIARAFLAVPGHYAFAILMGYYYSIYHFVDHSPRTAACILLVPILAHGVYDAIAFSGTLNPYFGALSMLILIFFCIRLHKFAKTKILAQLQKDEENMPPNMT